MMSYDPTLTANENDEARSNPSTNVYRVEMRSKKTLIDKIKTRLNKISLEENAVKSFYYGMKSSLLYVSQGIVGLVTLTLWEPNWTTRAITLRAKHSRMAHEIRVKKEQDRIASENAVIEAVKSETEDKPKVLSEDEAMEQWLKKYKGE